MRVIAVLFLVYGVWTSLWGLVVFFVLFWSPAEVMARFDQVIPAVVQWLLPPAFFVVGSFASLAGVGLLRRAEWARPTATLMALVSLLFFPVGTVFGALALWVLSRKAQGEGISAAAAPSGSA